MDLRELSKDCNVNCGECEDFEQCCYLVSSKKNKDKSKQKNK